MLFTNDSAAPILFSIIFFRRNKSTHKKYSILHIIPSATVLSKYYFLMRNWNASLTRDIFHMKKNRIQVRSRYRKKIIYRAGKLIINKTRFNKYVLMTFKTIK